MASFLPVQAGAALDLADSPIPQLPDAVIVEILAHVSLPIRLSSCAAVCKAWAAAAVRATSSVQLVHRDGVQRLPLLQSWLSQSESPALTSLQLEGVDTGEGDMNLVLASVLEQLPGLQVLEVQDCHLYPATISSITAMQNLQGLSMGFYAVPEGARNQLPAALPYGLTQLDITIDKPQYTNITDSGATVAAAADMPAEDAMPWPVCMDSLPHLQHLQDLKLASCFVDADVLGTLTALQKLHLRQCELWGFANWPPARQAGTLPRALLLLTRLQALSLSNQLGFTWDDYRGPPVPPELCSALTAAAQLTSLELHDMVLPHDAFQRMFPAGCCKSQLQVLRFEHTEDRRGVDRSYDTDDLFSPLCLDGGDLLSIAHACPGLHTLELSNCVQPETTLAWMQQLPDSLSSLSIAGQAFGDEAAADIAQLRQLRTLAWSYPMYELSIDDFRCLTALTGLTALSYQPYDCAELYKLFIYTGLGVSHASGVWSACSSAEKGPVWQQVQAVYDRLVDAEEMLAQAQAEESLQRATCDSGRQALTALAFYRLFSG